MRTRGIRSALEGAARLAIGWLAGNRMRARKTLRVATGVSCYVEGIANRGGPTRIRASGQAASLPEGTVKANNEVAWLSQATS